MILTLDDAEFFSLTSSYAKRSYGGKATNLSQMIKLGLNVPNGLVIPTDYSTWQALSYDAKATYKKAKELVESTIKDLASKEGMYFGKQDQLWGAPMLVSVRSGAPISMPGMMDTILNIGLNDQSVEVLSSLANEKFAFDSYRRLLSMWGETVVGLDPELFKKPFEAMKKIYLGKPPAEAYRHLVNIYKGILGDTFPQDPFEQVEGAVIAVWKSWNSPKAKAYRKIENIPDDLGTAVTIQRMVFGNFNDRSATGVLFTRNPNNGKNEIYGDFLINAQGEDVVDGSTKTMNIMEMEKYFPEAFNTLKENVLKLENKYGDMCDVEFTIENEQLFILQTRVGKRSINAEAQIAFDFFTEGKIGSEVAISRVNDAIQRAMKINSNGLIDGDHLPEIAKGLGAVPGEVVGKIALSVESAIKMSENDPVVLVTHETSPNDVEGMSKAVGILTASGGLVSHAAVVARGWDKVCVVGAGDLHVSSKFVRIQGCERILKEGDLIKINGTTGFVYA
jgi:pyruvate,orthophosphate dikinase